MPLRSAGAPSRCRPYRHSLKQIHGGPHRVLVDKAGILQGVGFPLHKVDPTEQAETLRGLLVWFWHNLSHFITALGRGEFWAAYGALDREMAPRLAAGRGVAYPAGVEAVILARLETLQITVLYDYAK